MNSSGSEYGAVVSSRKHSNENFGSVNGWFRNYNGDYQLLGKEPAARNRYVNWHQVNRPITEAAEVNVYRCIQRRQKALESLKSGVQ
jgi:hypothetical protein